MVSFRRGFEIDVLKHEYLSSVHEIVSSLPLTERNFTQAIRSYPRSEEEEAKTKNVWLKGHTGMEFQRELDGLADGGFNVKTSGHSLFSTVNLWLRFKS
jgi:hypothetical protein